MLVMWSIEMLCMWNLKESSRWDHTIQQVKVQWKHLSPEESTWELESVMREAYPILLHDEDMEE